MLILLAALSVFFQTYLQSLKKDLTSKGFEVLLLVAVLAWVDLVVLLGLTIIGEFHLPAQPLFYLYWLGLTLLYVIEFLFLVVGLKQSLFLAVNTIASFNFALTAIYAFIFLGEPLSTLKLLIIILGIIGCALFFERNTKTTNIRHNRGLIYVLFSLFIAPVGGVLFKAATLQTSSYAQFLTGRLVMDAVYYTLFFGVVFAFWYRKNPFPQVKRLLASRQGGIYLSGTVLRTLLDSWLIYVLPISVFSIINILSIPTGYVVGKFKYGDRIKPRYIVGGIIILISALLAIYIKN